MGIVLEGLLDRTIHIRYAPNEDITSYELALLLKYFGRIMPVNPDNIPIRMTKWLEIPVIVQRHFIELKYEKEKSC